MPARNLAGIACIMFGFAVATSCNEHQSDATPAYVGLQPVLPQESYDYDLAEDPDNKVATLGRVLFYDRSLSVDNTTSCGSCHKQAYAFTDARQLSAGARGYTANRNAMPVQNLAYVSFVQPTTSGGTTIINPYGSASAIDTPGGFFWDGREGSLLKMVLQPITGRSEMGNTTVSQAVERISTIPYYKQLFADASKYMNTSDPKEQVAIALAAFVRSIKSKNTKFDQYKAGTGQLTDDELIGLGLFQNKYNCNNCHRIEETEQLTPRFANIGLDEAYDDQGLADVTATSADDGKFRVPSLRNVAYTAPYMHDGRFPALKDVIQHYSDGIADHPNLHRDLKDEAGRPRKMDISPQEAQSIIAFLKTLSDESVLTDKRFSNPFQLK